jgi:tRNA threonylcarbamoyl adenosine modification protein YjeE
LLSKKFKNPRTKKSVTQVEAFCYKAEAFCNKAEALYYKTVEDFFCKLLSEDELQNWLKSSLIDQLRPGERIFLEGEMGAGKSTCSRMLLELLTDGSLAEGSPSFAIAHEYRSARFKGGITHTDWYRIRSEEELEETGLLEGLFHRDEDLFLVEWGSLFPSIVDRCIQMRRCWLIHLAFEPQNPLLRRVEVKKLWNSPG